MRNQIHSPLQLPDAYVAEHIDTVLTSSRQQPEHLGMREPDASVVEAVIGSVVSVGWAALTIMGALKGAQVIYKELTNRD